MICIGKIRKKYLHLCKKNIYRKRTIITRGLYIHYPIFESNFFVFKEFFWKILSLCMVSILERFLIKSRFWWRAYNIWPYVCKMESK